MSMKYQLIHEDVRGTINCFYVDDVEYTLLYTNEGYARGGCIHNVVEHAAILMGEVEYHVENVKVKIYRKGEVITIPPETPHYFVALSKALVLEWGAPPDQKRRRHAEYRKMVDAINKKKDSEWSNI